MNEQAFTQAFTDRLLESGSEDCSDGLHASAAFEGSIRDVISQIVAFLRSKGVTWVQLFSKAAQIYSVISAIFTAGGSVDWKSLAAAIWKIFFPDTPFPLEEIGLPGM